ncbi:Alpha/Beta hydrolase protein [Apodospora peruviana]|uniref:Alpha/Beta hydrolase protein n=1 Tax=Apodospora peruviana TaxID=516989 RepID=A0AAE0MC36_9PEZI|nr:Alpha/Beta hydrolase protein [Apodospora peruviana]
MKRLSFKIMRKRPVQLTAQSSLVTSAAAPDSGFAFVHNSQGASAALSELSRKLSGVLELIDLDTDDDAKDGAVKAQLQRLETVAGDYTNSSSASSCSGMEEWKGSPSLAQVVAAAFVCSATIYKKPPKSTAVHDSDDATIQTPSPDSQQVATTTHRQPTVDGLVFTEQTYTKPSRDGTEKAMGVWMAKSDTGQDWEGFPAMVIAVRGTAKLVDAMVNANGRPVTADEFLGPSETDPATRDATLGIKAHAGFLNGAKALYTVVKEHLSRADKEHPGMHVIFTGHSAGGAVSSLLYAKCLLEARKSYPSLKLSSITFGSPPCLSIDITPILRHSEALAKNHGHTLAFVNEFDIVPRVDQAYIRSLIDLYRASYNLGPLMADAVKQEDKKTPDLPYVLPPLEFQFEDEADDTKDGGSGQQEHEAGKVWKLPIPQYHILGDIVLLRKDRVVVDAAVKRVLRAYSFAHDEYEKLLYVGTQTHSRTYYQDRVSLLQEGRFNDRQSWE